MFNKLPFFILFFILSILLSCLVVPDFSRAQPESSHYLIGANDILSIYVWKEPDLSRDVTVMPDGRISFPLIGEVVAREKTVSELKNIISDKLEKYVTAPEVTVIVSQSLSRTVYTIGKLGSPGPFPLAPNMTVLQALSTAGGFSEWADTKNILIVRREGGKEVQIRFNYKEFTDGKNLQQNILLKPNDTIVVP
jgi:polysaccharide export outer membrane protein